MLSTFTPGLSCRAAIWSAPRSRATSASPCWISRRREAGSGTFLIMMLLIFGAPVGGAGVGLQHDGLMRLVDAHFIGPAARRVHLQPVVAEVVIFRVRRHLFFIHDRGDGVERIFSATAGLTSAVQCSVRVWSSTFFSWLAMLSGCQPSTLRINAGDLFSVTARV